MVWRVMVPVAGLLFGVVSTAVYAQDAAEVLRGIRDRYEDLRDLQLIFTQKTTFAGSRVERRTEGRLFLKKEGKYRVETDDQVLVTDGTTIWSYSADTRQVLIDHYRGASGGWTLERVLTGAGGDYESTLLGKERINGVDAVGIKLIPRDEAPAVRSLKLWADLSGWLIRRAEVEDLNGVTSVYTVADVRINPGLSDSRFSYVIPDGADVVDLR